MEFDPRENHLALRSTSPPWLGCSSPTSSISPPVPPTPPPGVINRDLNVIEVGLLKHATVTGSLEDVHRILAQYISTQTPDPTTGRLWLSLFAESIREAIARDYSNILSYLFFMRVGVPAANVSYAITTRSSTIFQVFLDYGWNINEPIERAMAPALGYISDDKALTTWFLDHGADPNATCAWDFTPMSVAMFYAPLDVIRMLFERGGDVKRGQLLHNAVLRDGPDTLELLGLLLDAGAAINEIHYENHPQAYSERYAFALGTPLHYAVREDKPELVSYLLQRGADYSIKDTLGRTAFQTAEFLRKHRVVQVLYSNTLQVNKE